MADKAINQLSEVSTGNLQDNDLFVLEHNGEACKMKWKTLIDSTDDTLRGWGGISNVQYTAPASGSLNGTLTISYTEHDSPSTFTITNGAKGDTGPQGIQGETGAGAYITSFSSSYCYSTDGVNPPQDGWSTTVPAPQEGKFLWSRSTNNWNDGSSVDSYCVSKVGANGSGAGSVTSVGVEGGSGISVTGSPITDSGVITVGHSNSVNAKETVGLYPVSFDSSGHITASGSAATLDTLGGIKNPTTKTSGQYLKYDGTNWVADSVSAGVTSVNTKTGAVTLSSSDVGAIANPSTKDSGQYLKYDGSAWVASDIAASGYTMTLIWSNASTGTGATYGAKTESISGSGYKAYYVVFRQSSGGQAYASFVYPVGGNYNLACVSLGWGNTTQYKRVISSATNTGITFTNGKTTANNSTSNTDSSAAMIPAYIYGIK